MRKTISKWDSTKNTNGTEVAYHFWERPGEKSFRNKMIIYSFQNVNIAYLANFKSCKKISNFKSNFVKGAQATAGPLKFSKLQLFHLDFMWQKALSGFCSLMKNVIHASWSHGVLTLTPRIHFLCSSSVTYNSGLTHYPQSNTLSIFQCIYMHMQFTG